MNLRKSVLVAFASWVLSVLVSVVFIHASQPLALELHFMGDVFLYYPITKAGKAILLIILLLTGYLLFDLLKDETKLAPKHLRTFAAFLLCQLMLLLSPSSDAIREKPHIAVLAMLFRPDSITLILLFLLSAISLPDGNKDTKISAFLMPVLHLCIHVIRTANDGVPLSAYAILHLLSAFLPLMYLIQLALQDPQLNAKLPEWLRKLFQPAKPVEITVAPENENPGIRKLHMKEIKAAKDKLHSNNHATTFFSILMQLVLFWLFSPLDQVPIKGLLIAAIGILIIQIVLKIMIKQSIEPSFDCKSAQELAVYTCYSNMHSLSSALFCYLFANLALFSGRVSSGATALMIKGLLPAALAFFLSAVLLMLERPKPASLLTCLAMLAVAAALPFLCFRLETSSIVSVGCPALAIIGRLLHWYVRRREINKLEG